jgi:hypothetical protein
VNNISKGKIYIQINKESLGGSLEQSIGLLKVDLQEMINNAPNAV